MTTLTIEERILQAELNFFLNEAREAEFLILTPNSYAELFSYDSDYEDNVSYEGLIVAVTNHGQVLDFELA